MWGNGIPWGNSLTSKFHSERSHSPTGLKKEYLLLLKFRIFILEASSSCHTLFSHSHLQGIKMPTPYIRQIFTINNRKRSKLHFNEIQIRRRKSVLFISPHKSYLFIFVSLCFSPFTKAKRANIINIATLLLWESYYSYFWPRTGVPRIMFPLAYEQ